MFRTWVGEWEMRETIKQIREKAKIDMEIGKLREQKRILGIIEKGNWCYDNKKGFMTPKILIQKIKDGEKT